MKLNTIQLLWLLGAVAVFARVLVDVVGIVQVPPAYWMLGFGALALVGWWVMPSLSELRKVNRRRSD